MTRAPDSFDAFSLPDSEQPLGIQRPLLPAAALGQSMLQPKFLTPLGARSLTVLDPSIFSAQAAEPDEQPSFQEPFFDAPERSSPPEAESQPQPRQASLQPNLQRRLEAAPAPPIDRSVELESSVPIEPEAPPELFPEVIPETEHIPESLGEEPLTRSPQAELIPEPVSAAPAPDIHRSVADVSDRSGTIREPTPVQSPVEHADVWETSTTPGSEPANEPFEPENYRTEVPQLESTEPLSSHATPTQLQPFSADRPAAPNSFPEAPASIAPTTPKPTPTEPSIRSPELTPSPPSQPTDTVLNRSPLPANDQAEQVTPASSGTPIIQNAQDESESVIARSTLDTSDVSNTPNTPDLPAQPSHAIPDTDQASAAEPMDQQPVTLSEHSRTEAESSTESTESLKLQRSEETVAQPTINPPGNLSDKPADNLPGNLSDKPAMRSEPILENPPATQNATELPELPELPDPSQVAPDARETSPEPDRDPGLPELPGLTNLSQAAPDTIARLPEEDSVAYESLPESGEPIQPFSADRPDPPSSFPESPTSIAEAVPAPTPTESSARSPELTPSPPSQPTDAVLARSPLPADDEDEQVTPASSDAPIIQNTQDESESVIARSTLDTSDVSNTPNTPDLPAQPSHAIPNTDQAFAAEPMEQQPVALSENPSTESTESLKLQRSEETVAQPTINPADNLLDNLSGNPTGNLSDKPAMRSEPILENPPATQRATELPELPELPDSSQVAPDARETSPEPDRDPGLPELPGLTNLSQAAPDTIARLPEEDSVAYESLPESGEPIQPFSADRPDPPSSFPESPTSIAEVVPAPTPTEPSARSPELTPSPPSQPTDTVLNRSPLPANDQAEQITPVPAAAPIQLNTQDVQDRAELNQEQSGIEIEDSSGTAIGDVSLQTSVDVDPSSGTANQLSQPDHQPRELSSTELGGSSASELIAPSPSADAESVVQLKPEPALAEIPALQEHQPREVSSAELGGSSASELIAPSADAASVVQLKPEPALAEIPALQSVESAGSAIADTADTDTKEVTAAKPGSEQVPIAPIPSPLDHAPTFPTPDLPAQIPNSAPTDSNPASAFLQRADESIATSADPQTTALPELPTVIQRLSVIEPLTQLRPLDRSPEPSDRPVNDPSASMWPTPQSPEAAFPEITSVQRSPAYPSDSPSFPRDRSSDSISSIEAPSQWSSLEDLVQRSPAYPSDSPSFPRDRSSDNISPIAAPSQWSSLEDLVQRSIYDRSEFEASGRDSERDQSPDWDFDPELTADSSTRSAATPTIQRVALPTETPASENATVPETPPEQPQSQSQQASPEQFEQLAREVYRFVRQRLALERERSGKYSGRLL